MGETPDRAFSNAGKRRIGLPVGRFRTLREVNKQNRLFWRKQSKLRDKRLADEEVLQVAMNDLQHETLRHLSAYSQKTLEEALEIAADSKARFQRTAAKDFHIAFSRKGGKARKTDALQKLIQKIARENPDVTGRQLLHRLKKDASGAILHIDGENDVRAGDAKTIHFTEHDGVPKTARLSGLKDRLSRAKKK